MKGDVSLWVEVRALLGLRWRMVRQTRVQMLFLLLVVAVTGLLVLGTLAAPGLPSSYDIGMSTLLGSLLLLFPILVFMSGMAAGGGVEAIPASHLVAYPVSPRTVFMVSLILTPLNVAWTAQVIAMVWLASAVFSRYFDQAAGLLLVGAFIVTATLLGLAVSWTVTGLRSSWWGRRATEALLATVLVGLAWPVVTGGVDGAFERLPLAEVAVALLLPGPTRPWVWAGILAVALPLSVLAGFRATAWALSRRDDGTRAAAGRSLRRRVLSGGQLAALMAIDRASVLRSRPVRRGLVLFSIVPGLAAAASGMPWRDIVIIPGLVATGAALLFAINAFSIDGSGAAWLESSPRSVDLAFASKALTVAWFTSLVVGLSLLVAAIGARSVPRFGDAAVILLCVTSTVAASTAVAMRQSIRRPFKADLTSPRDTPAPPATMTAHSLRLAATAVLVGMAFVVAIRLPSITPAVGLAVVVLALAVLHLTRSAMLWRQAQRRAAVIAAVAYG